MPPTLCIGPATVPGHAHARHPGAGRDPVWYRCEAHQTGVVCCARWSHWIPACAGMTVSCGPQDEARGATPPRSDCTSPNHAVLHKITRNPPTASLPNHQPHHKSELCPNLQSPSAPLLRIPNPRPGACRAWEGRGENPAVRAQISDGLSAHSGAMGREDGGNMGRTAGFAARPIQARQALLCPLPPNPCVNVCEAGKCRRNRDQSSPGDAIWVLTFY